jgi:hypothetical protein
MMDEATEAQQEEDLAISVVEQSPVSESAVDSRRIQKRRAINFCLQGNVIEN